MSRWAVGLLALAVPALAACEAPADRAVVAVLAPGDTATLAAEPGRTAFAERIAQRCPDCLVRVHTEGATPEVLREVLADGADVVVVEALTADQGEALVATAGSVPLVAFDRYFDGADYFVSYDRSSTGAEVAEAVSRGIRRGSSALVVNGSTTDTDLDLVEDGLREGFAVGEVDVAAALEPATATAGETRDWVRRQLAEGRPRMIGAVVTVSDEQAVGALAALRSSAVRRADWPMVTGVGADLAAVRRIIDGGQTLSVHMPIGVTAVRAADLALALASETSPDLAGSIDYEGVPAFVHVPVVITRDNVTDVVVRDGTFTTEELCSGSVEATCARLGIR